MDTITATANTNHSFLSSLSIKKFYSKLGMYFQNRRTRKQLSELPEYLLRDVGITQEQVDKELKKSFWE
ncbi:MULTISPECIES: DUF1127 domain-containing protein [Vibrio]|jgi:uncharacterized protein YjiS (DUF1127 family)|uniref:DUF1127 domain-containing protein n=1 Tax=Vibrio TaxID=662 RepID=UPI000C81D235|nr:MULTISPECIES: DUF1127 domain-containing protein [unclassified Vibrio]MCC4890148.1 DUF1127 domain-containing protein [Vibrio sp. F13]PMK29016.1 hypothetical protein BCU05_00460 [Vibrio sp. 10N.261.54.C3]PMO00284.1 hypothetical protein BCT20_00940 [Vibrio sp. 10N.222.55.C12]PMO17341.1 hypothetical protein BCT17_01365 [Vibrio sp. 10N.222.54.F10]PMO25500.1 hypothetical protein BCT16_02965 [Vibrio sp. 10N.222.54.B6]